MKKYSYLFVIALLAVFGVAMLANGYVGGTPKVVVEGDYIEAPQAEQTLGSVSGPDVYFPMYFHDTITTGGNVLASSTAHNSTTGTLTSKQVFSNGQLDYTVTGSAISLTLPATSTITEIRTAGECFNYKIRNLGSAASTTTIVAGTGIDLMEIGDGDATNVVIAGGNLANLKFCRESDKDITVTVAEYSPAD